MKEKGKWAILIATVIIVSLVMVSSPVAACFGHRTTCEGESVYQGDGGGTDYWYDDLYPPEHEIAAGAATTWTINVDGGGGCSGYEHCTVTDDDPPTDWTTTIKMGTISQGSFHFIEPGNPAVNTGDVIEDKEFYIGNNWDFDIIYEITSPSGAPGGSAAEQTCTIYVVGYNPENQHDYVYVHCTARIVGLKPPALDITYPTYAVTLTGTMDILWNAISMAPTPSWSFDIFLSSDLGVTYPYTLVSDFIPPGLGPSFSWSWDTTSWPDDNKYVLKIRAFDGSEYAEAISPGNFTIENVAPDPPSNLIIHFGLTTNGEPTVKAPDDDTGSDLERLYVDDLRAYIVPKGKKLSMETFNTTIQADPVESATLYVKYWINDTGYSGFNPVTWKLETDLIYQPTDIIPMANELTPTVKTFDLFANGVDTISEIADLDIRFENDDGGSFGPQGVMFDCLWITFKASPNDLGLTWTPSPSPDVDHYHIWKSTNNVAFSKVDETPFTLWRDPGTAVDLSNYFYKVRAVDLRGNEGLPSYTVAKFVTSFSDGWNLRSNPLIPQIDTSIENVMQSVDGIYDNIWTYHAGDSMPWLHWYSKKPARLDTLSDMNHVDGYYMEMQSSGNMISLGIVPENTIIPLKAGWNLIGYPSINPQTVDDALLSIAGNYNWVKRFDTASDCEVEMLGSDSMYPGQGYWIYATNNCDLIL